MGIVIVEPGPSFSWWCFCSCNKSKYQKIVQELHSVKDKLLSAVQKCTILTFYLLNSMMMLKYLAAIANHFVSAFNICS